MLRSLGLPEESTPLNTEVSGRVPDAFGPFRVLHQIGAGALGPVFRAYEPDRDRLVAVKLYRLDLPPERVHQLVNEFERLIAGGLTHPAITTPISTGIDDNLAYLAQDYVVADSLDIIVRDNGPAPAADAIRIAAQVAAALDFAAVVNVTHGALHPRDVLIISPDETRLTGLGVARALERVGVSAPVRRPYTAPERIAGAPWDRRADIFSLAAVVHELLWGRRVSGTGHAAAEGLTDIAGGNLDALREVFACALAEEPARRFESALAFAERLNRAFPDVRPSVGGEPAPARKRGAREPRPDLTQEARLPLDFTDEPQPEPVVEPASDAADAILFEAPHGSVQEPLAAMEPHFDVERVFDAAPEIPLRRGGGAIGDLDLRAAEAKPFEEGERGPAFASPPSPPVEPPASTPPVGLSEPSAIAPFDFALERSRSAIWPLVLALVVGLALGFAGGYAVGGRDHVAAVMASPPAPLAAAVETPHAPAAGATPRQNAPPAPRVASRPSHEPAAVETEAGRLLVRSKPSGARVLVDGREAGVTPLTVRDLARGSHRLRLVYEGYAPVDRHVVVTARHPAQALTIALARTHAAAPSSRAAAGASAGALTIDSRPSNARAYLDGRLVGKTPVQLPQVSAGSHLVRLEHDGYRRWSSSVSVVSGEKNRVTASLEK